MTKVLSVEGMNCNHCASAVEKALRSVPGVKEATVDLAAKKATIETEGNVAGELLKQAVALAGFSVVDIR